MERFGKSTEKKQLAANTLADSYEQPGSSVGEQVEREFEYSEDLGTSDLEPIETELSEQKYLLPSPNNSLEDTAIANITADEKGLAYGIANQRNEPLDMTGKRQKRDEDRWELNSASAESEEA